jgi:hypothetical protein
MLTAGLINALDKADGTPMSDRELCHHGTAYALANPGDHGDAPVLYQLLCRAETGPALFIMAQKLRPNL